MAIRYLIPQDDVANVTTWAWLLGKGSTKGRPILWDNEGSRKKIIIGLCSGGRYGCDGIDAVYYKGFQIPELDGGGNRNWRFHRGTRSAGWNDPEQGRPEFFPTLNHTFSLRAYVEVLIPEDLTEGEDADEQPGEFQIYLRGFRVMSYSVSALGRLKEEGVVYSANNSYVAIYLAREGGKIPLSRFHRWAQTWVDYRDYCSTNLSWNNGTSTVSVPRFDAHVVFPSTVDPWTAMQAVFRRSPACMMQDVQGGFRVLVGPDRAHVHTFNFDPASGNASNIVKRGLSGVPRDPATIPNLWAFSYRDLLDPASTETGGFKRRKVTVNYPELRDSAGGTLNFVNFGDLGVMSGSLAQRIARCTARLQSEQPYDRRIDVAGQFDSSHVATNDYVRIVHLLLGNNAGTPKLARVFKESFEPRKGERKFGLQYWSADYYRDSDHGALED